LGDKKDEILIFDIQKELYRPFHFILSGLALYKSLKLPNSSFQLIDELFKGEASKNLKHAFLQILYLQFEAQQFYHQEKEFLYPPVIKNSDPSLLYFTEERLTVIQAIYKVLIPLWNGVKEFIQTEDFKVLKNLVFYDDSSAVVGEAFERSFQYKKAQQLYLSEKEPKNTELLVRLSTKLPTKQDKSLILTRKSKLFDQ